MKMYKKLIAVALIFALSVGFCSCNLFGLNTDNYAIALAAGKRQIAYDDYTSAEYVEFNNSLSSFAAKLSDRLYRKFGNEDGNLCFSPVSVYMTLALATECTDGKTRTELLDALGMSYDEVREFTAVLYSLCNRSYTGENALGREIVPAFSELHNSVWLDDSVKLANDSANSLAENYNADIFGVDFESGEAKRVISKYISDKTHGLIDGDMDMPPETVFVLLSTLYLKEIWLEMGKSLDKTSEKYDFGNTDGSTESLYLLESKYNLGKTYVTDDYQSFYASTKNGYKLHFILPNGSLSLSDVFSENTLNDILSLEDYSAVDDENRQIHHTRVLFPEFEAEFDEDISDVLKDDFGINELFSPDEANFSALSYDADFNLYCDSVIHRAKIEVDERGIEGAAFTAMLGANAAAPPEYEKVYHDFVVDSAFGFILTDSQGTVIFSGVVNDID